MAAGKGNVSKFNADVLANDGYRYTTNAPYSARVANRRINEAILEFIPRGCATVVDIGCGDGTYTEALREALPDKRFTGLEAAAEAVAVARRKYPSIEFAVFDLLDPSTFPRRRYDVGVIRGVIHHLPDQAAGIRNCALLTDRLVMMEPNGHNPVLKWLEKHSRYHIEHEEQSFTLRQLRNWCEDAGYRVMRTRVVGFVPFFFPEPLARLIHFFQPALESIPPLCKWLGAQIILDCEKAGREERMKRS